MKQSIHALIALGLLTACTQNASAGPLDPPSGQYACAQNEIVAVILPDGAATNVQTAPAPFGDLVLDGAGGYSLTGTERSKARYSADLDTGALRFTGVLAVFSNTYEVSNGTAHIFFQSQSFSFGCSRKSAFPGSFKVHTPMPGEAKDSRVAAGPLNGTHKGLIYFTKPDGLYTFNVETGTETFVRETDSFDIAPNGEFVWINRAGEMMTGEASGPVQTVPAYGARVAPKFSRNAERIVYMGETPPNSVDEAMLGATTTANRRPLVIDRNGNVLASFGNQYVEPSWTPDGRIIMAGSKAAGSLAGNAESGIFLSDRALSSVQRIDPGMELPHSPAVSRDGKRVAFASAGRIYVMGLDGSDAKVIAAGASRFVGSLAWSPQSDAVIFRDNEQVMVARLNSDVAPLNAQSGLKVYAKSNLVWTD